MFYVLLQIDLTYKIRIGSTVTKKQQASPGGQPRNGALYRRGEEKKHKKPGSVLSLTNEKWVPEKDVGKWKTKTLTWAYKIEIGERGVRLHQCKGLGGGGTNLKVTYSRVSKSSPRTPFSVFSLLPKHRVQYLNNNLKAISFPKDQILAIFCSLVSKEKRLSFQTSGITYLEKPPVPKPSNQDGSL